MTERACVDSFVAAVESATMPKLEGVFAENAVLDATVPNWRFTVRGDEGIRSELASWYAAAGRFEELTRTPLPDGELVEFVLTWTEDGVPYTCHQAHRLRVSSDRISSDTVWCGGRWSQSLLEEMSAAAAV